MKDSKELAKLYQIITMTSSVSIRGIYSGISAWAVI